MVLPRRATQNRRLTIASYNHSSPVKGPLLSQRWRHRKVLSYRRTGQAWSAASFIRRRPSAHIEEIADSQERYYPLVKLALQFRLVGLVNSLIVGIPCDCLRVYPRMGLVDVALDLTSDFGIFDLAGNALVIKVDFVALFQNSSHFWMLDRLGLQRSDRRGPHEDSFENHPHLYT